VIGRSKATGQLISGTEHLAQSIGDILTTPLGSRVMRRDYGSELPDLIDQPANPATRVRLYGAAATALARWEPRFTLQQVSLAALEGLAGRWQLSVAGTTSEGNDLTVTVNLGNAA